MWSIIERNAATVPASTDRAAVIGKAEFDICPAVDLAKQPSILRQADGFVPVLPPGELRLQARRGHDSDVVCSRALGKEPEHSGGRVAKFSSDRLELGSILHLRGVRQLV